MVKYNPPERTCCQCGKTIIVHDPAAYQYRQRDYCRTSETYGKTLWYCSRKCMREYDEQHPRKRYARVRD